MATVIFCTKHEHYNGKYIVIDWYDEASFFNTSPEVLARGCSRSEATDVRNQRILDTDGECEVEIYRMVYNPSNSGKLVEVESF